MNYISTGCLSQLLLTLSISSLFLFRAECVILTVTAPSCPCRRRAIRLGCSGLNEISSSGLGNRLVLPCSWEISKESSTEGPPAELCWNYNFHIFSPHSLKSKIIFLIKWDFKAQEGSNSANQTEDCGINLTFKFVIQHYSLDVDDVREFCKDRLWFNID